MQSSVCKGYRVYLPLYFSSCCSESAYNVGGHVVLLTAYVETSLVMIFRTYGPLGIGSRHNVFIWAVVLVDDVLHVE